MNKTLFSQTLEEKFDSKTTKKRQVSKKSGIKLERSVDIGELHVKSNKSDAKEESSFPSDNRRLTLLRSGFKGSHSGRGEQNMLRL